MAITYPLSLPASPGPARVTMRATNVVAVAASPFTGQQQTQRHPGAWWSADVELPPLMGEAEAETWISFLLSLRGRHGTFLMGDPARATPRGVATGTPVIDGADQTGEALATRGWTPDTTGILRAGDYIQIGQRLHKVLTDTDSDASGAATLDIWPRLRESPADGALIITANPVGTFRLSSNDTSWIWEAPKRAGVSFGVVEAL